MSTALDDLYDTFELLGDDWEERYRHLIDLGRQLPPLSDTEQVPANKVEGCMSQVWMVIGPDPAAPDRLTFRAVSDAHIVNGLIAVLRALYDGRPASEVLALDIDAAFARLGLDEHLSPNRRNGFAAMVGRIRQTAQQMTEDQA
ncbi:SufE family protein [Roseospirillum parvum]|uniref:Cysteine desulfuration protein SufE n=1 Tax=Roseospirillum parvum TaxID=83401 RepID=A0A1G8EFA5_9PROT|nr:SufE family protein [Roseospirillum parvum]SDH68369.1 cysteine desulfuration protein SufE [Roseospirillum parvum]